MTPSEKIKICSTCKNSKWNKDCGIVCGLTNAKPDFHLNCEHYLKDEKEVETVKRNEEILSSQVDDTLNGADWFKTISILSVINIGLSFAGVQFIFSLSSTQLIQEAIKYDLINPVLGILGILIIPVFFMWTWWLTAKKGYKLCYNIGWAVYLLDTLLLVYMFVNTNVTSILVDIVIHLIVLFAFLKIFSVNLSKNNSKPFAWGGEKVCYLLLALATVIVPARSITSIHNAINNAKQIEASEMAVDEIDRKIQGMNAVCPIEFDGGSMLKVERKARSIEWTIKYNVKYENYEPSTWASIAEMHKLVMLNKNTISGNFDILYLNKFNLVYHAYDINSRFLYDIVITPDDDKAAKANPLSPDKLIDISLEYQRLLCPRQFDEFQTLQTINKNDESIVYQYIVNVRYEDFSPQFLAKTAADEKAEMMTNIRYSDIFTDLIFNQGYNIVYSYCDSNSKLLYEVVITPDEYKAAKALLK